MKVQSLQTHRILPITCPSCGRVMNGATEPSGSERGPQEGDYSVCIECGTLLVFGSDLKVSLADVDEIASHGTEYLTWLLRLRAAIIECQKGTPSSKRTTRTPDAP